ncbi:MAG TPA: thermonuclease family protein [candidate division Zixibacteria bacterium]|nr:thermonuclease family protein [candidate division Zixibacteria bacterium]MDD4917907.1 thermonuclease family protein [candidate division Zixibacteria bacterium]MDM7972016.1 thermonuclease family protein [candidate division Zixibacteria bacterium]HOD66209.1 thermonuclease family protein [candidate division Zixibacteria bacterium]HPC11380.1 thermonuclease family protein [candidate division Zixibacteria bacterium]
MARKRKHKARLAGRLALLLVLIAAVLIVRRSDIGRDPAPVPLTTVVKIIDGDTMVLGNGETVRLLAIDTPEDGEPLHDEAAALLAQVALGKEARIVSSGRRRDTYGRLLAYVYVDDTLLVNRVLVDSGLAYVYLFRDTDTGRPETDRIIAAQRAALDRRAGLFALPRAAEPYYVAGRTSYRFHRPGCPSTAEFTSGRARTFATRRDALAEGLSPCRRCKP